jgi:hypothetical protein
VTEKTVGRSSGTFSFALTGSYVVAVLVMWSWILKEALTYRVILSAILSVTDPEIATSEYTSLVLSNIDTIRS